MGKLIAKAPVLYRGRMYEAGDVLPCDDAAMVAAWRRSGSVEAKLPEQERPPLHMEQLEKMTVTELKNMACNLGVDMTGAKLKGELMALLSGLNAQQDQKQPAESDGEP